LNRRIGEREHATLALTAITHLTDPAVTDLTLALKVLAVLVSDTLSRSEAADG
jgi:hypothetical protein